MKPTDFRPQYPIMALGMLALLAAMWAGLLRMGWAWPLLQPALPMAHGPLMISGFLGTVIGVERAIALNRRWMYFGPLLSGLGGLALIIGLPAPVGALLVLLGSATLVLIFGVIVKIETAPYTLTMALGALLWLAGNGLWLTGRPIYTVVYWWTGFVVLTIAGERLELGRILRHSKGVQTLFAATVGLYVIGLVASLGNFDIGVRTGSAATIILAVWLFRFDVARYTVKKSGLTRFIAICLLSGYGWLGLGGALGMLYGGVTAGFQYDAILHSVYIGFVMAMIFGHAPIIFPAVLGRAIPFAGRFYFHLILLNVSLLLRLAGDLAFQPAGRQWGGLLNVAAILWFIANTALSVQKDTSSS